MHGDRVKDYCKGIIAQGKDLVTDFKMPVGTPVHAARKGVVVKLKTDSSVGGGNRKYEDDANYIIIRHSDGTLGNYAHLQNNGSTVKVGQYVLAGDQAVVAGKNL
jgi:murein DD-endopeptidase MepM/ murein hydrolase activator NlpD